MKRLLLIVIVNVLMLNTYAVKTEDLYAIDAHVATQLDNERAQVVQQGFLQVLRRVTGDAQIFEHPDIKPLLKKADYYVQEYTYSAPSALSSQYELEVHYSKADIERLLKRIGIPLWGENRPLILVWLATTDKHRDNKILGNEEPTPLLTTIKQAATNYGLPIIFPMMDVDEVSELDPEQVLQMEWRALNAASKRYAADGILVGNIAANDTGFQSEWQLAWGDHQWRWSISGKTEADIINEMIARVTQSLSRQTIAKNPPVINLPQMWLTIEVENILNANDLKQLLTFLKGLKTVEKLSAPQVVGQGVQISILIQGSLQELQKNIAQYKKLILKVQDEDRKKLVYEWPQKVQ